MNNNEQDGAKSRRTKTIIVSAIALVVIIFVGVWAITGAIGSGKKKTDNKQTETTNVEEKKDENSATTITSPSDQYSTTNNNTQTPVENAPVVTNENIPQTGASEVVFSALMLGVVATLVTLNLQLVKKRN